MTDSKQGVVKKLGMEALALYGAIIFIAGACLVIWGGIWSNYGNVIILIGIPALTLSYYKARELQNIKKKPSPDALPKLIMGAVIFCSIPGGVYAFAMNEQGMYWDIAEVLSNLIFSLALARLFWFSELYIDEKYKKLRKNKP